MASYGDMLFISSFLQGALEGQLLVSFTQSDPDTTSCSAGSPLDGRWGLVPVVAEESLPIISRGWVLDAIVGDLKDLVLAWGLILAREIKGIGGRWSCPRVPEYPIKGVDNGDELSSPGWVSSDSKTPCGEAEIPMATVNLICWLSSTEWRDEGSAWFSELLLDIGGVDGLWLESNEFKERECSWSSELFIESREFRNLGDPENNSEDQEDFFSLRSPEFNGGRNCGWGFADTDSSGLL
jgi:hypothetical protein